MKKCAVCFLLACMVLFSTTACAKDDPEPDVADRIVLGFSQLGDESEWRTSSTKDINRAAEQADIQIMFENAQQKQFNQIKAIRSFILNGVDIIAFSPIVEEGWDNVLNEAKDAGIPVILVDRTIRTKEEGLYCSFIGSDFYSEGVRAAQWMLTRFDQVESTVKIAEIIGTEDSSPTIGRHEGFLSAVEDNSKFETVISISGDFMRSKGRECMEVILAETPDVDVLFAHNDDMALGAIEIMEEHGIHPGKDIAVISIDAQKSGLEALKQGKINCLIECNPYVGDELMALIQKIIAGEPFPELTYVEEKVFTDKDDIISLPVRP